MMMSGSQLLPVLLRMPALDKVGLSHPRHVHRPSGSSLMCVAMTMTKPKRKVMLASRSLGFSDCWTLFCIVYVGRGSWVTS